eukprot:2489315-Karenia_brevis.AAC.1
MPSSENWPGQATAIAASTFCQTIEDNCLAIAEERALVHDRATMTLKGDSLLTIHLAGTANDSDTIAEQINKACALRLGILCHFRAKSFPPATPIHEIHSLFTSHATHSKPVQPLSDHVPHVTPGLRAASPPTPRP